jgi:hypothetical protein
LSLGLRFKVKNASKVCPFCITEYNSVTGVATELYFISFASKLKCLALKPNSDMEKLL